MENLRSVRKYITLTSGLWHTLATTVTFGAIFLMLGRLPNIAVLIITYVLLLVLTWIISIILSKSSTATTEFLARAILHVSSETADAPAPNAQSLKAGNEFMERLASYVYDMSSKSVMSQYPSGTASTSQAPLPADLINMSPLPFFAVNKYKEISAVSQSACDFLGTTKENIIGKPIYDVLRFMFSSDDTLDNWLEFAKDKSATAKRSWDRVKLVTPSETTKQVDMSVHYSKDEPNGNEVVIVLFDHTDKYGQDDSGASFVSMAVHELRTPLTIMRGYIEVFEDEIADKLDSEQTEFLRNLSVQAQQLGSFVSNIQNLARIEANNLELKLLEEKWDEVLSSTLNDMDTRARVRHKTIVRNIATDLPTVGIDKTTIYEVIVNLLENAIKYTHTDAPIEVSTYLTKEGNYVETTIQDHGIGIPDSLLGHIFDKFYRSHRTSKSVGGTGLGLYISKTIVEAHGGEIWVKTKEGEGSTFGFTVPVFSTIASEAISSDNKAIERSAHGWIKNHTLYRG